MPSRAPELTITLVEEHALQGVSEAGMLGKEAQIERYRLAASW